MTAAYSERLPARIEGDRLLLRRWMPDDVDDLGDIVLANLEHLRPWMPWIALEPLTRDDRLALEHEWDERWRNGGDCTYAMVLLETGDIVGSTGLHRRRGPTTLEIGYWVDHGHVGRGIATEAAGMLTAAAFQITGIDAVEIHHDKANVASGRVPEKLGFVFVGEGPDEVTAPGETGVDCTWRATPPWPPG